MQELVELERRLRELLDRLAREGRTFECDVLHGRIGEVENVQAMLVGEDETLNALARVTSDD